MSLIPSDLRHEAIQNDLDIISDDKNTKAMMNRVAIAKSLGIDERFAIGGISRINVTNQQPPDAPAQPATPNQTPPALATVGAGLSGLAKTGLAAAGIFGTGGLGVGVAALMGAFNAAAPGTSTLPTPTAVVQPAAATPNGQVTIGIDELGHLFNPNAGPTQ